MKHAEFRPGSGGGGRSPLHWLSFFAATALLVLAAGCGGSDGGQSADGKVSATLTTSSFPTDTTALPYLYPDAFAELGINLSVTSMKGGGDTIRAVATGDIDFGDTSAAAAAQAMMSGAPIVIIGGSGQTAINYNFIAMPGSDIRSIADLSGRIAGFTSPGSATEILLDLTLKRAGVTGVKTRATGGIGEGLTALEGGAIDVTAIVQPQLAASANRYKVVWKASDFVDSYQSSVIVTNRKFLERNPDTVRAFLKARAAVVDRIGKDPVNAAQRWGTALRIDPKVIVPVIQENVAAKQWGVGLSLKGLQAVAETMSTTLDITGPVPWGDIINQDFLPEGTTRIDPNQISGHV
jgi:NitT/TauT family transport system substrate-binding protein